MPKSLLDSLSPCRPFPSLLRDEYKFHDNPSLIRFMSLGGVFDLIRNRRLRFSSVSRFRANDPSEGLGGLPLRPHMLGFGNLLYSIKGTSFAYHAKPTKHFPATFWDEVSRNNYGPLKEKILWAKKQSQHFLCSCFHVYHEEPYHMWELYGGRGAGLALCINKEAVLNALPRELQDHLLIGWGEVFYAFNLAEAAQHWDDADLPESLIRIKSSRFKPEQEFRFFVHSKEPLEYICLPFNPRAVEAIILGPHLLHDDRIGIHSELLEALQSEQLQQIRIIDSEETQIRNLVQDQRD